VPVQVGAEGAGTPGKNTGNTTTGGVVATTAGGVTISMDESAAATKNEMATAYTSEMIADTGTHIGVAAGLYGSSTGQEITGADILNTQINGVNVSDPSEQRITDMLSLQSTKSCSESGITWEPLDLKGHPMTREYSMDQCQARCVATRECAHYSYWVDKGYCHLQSAFATRVTNQEGYISGPPSCTKVEGNKRTLTILAKANGCYTESMAYTPLDMEGTMPTEVRDILDCQEQCSKRDGCEHFTYDMLTTTCHLSDKHAMPVKNLVYQVSGPKACKGKVQFQVNLENVAYELIKQSEHAAAEFEGAIQEAIATQIGSGIHPKEISVMLKAEDADVNLRGLMPKDKQMEEKTGVTMVKVAFYPPEGTTGDSVHTTLSSFRDMQYAIADRLGKVGSMDSVAKGDVKVSQLRQIGLEVPTEAKYARGAAVAGSRWQLGAWPLAAAVMVALGMVGNLAVTRLHRLGQAHGQRAVPTEELLEEEEDRLREGDVVSRGIYSAFLR